MDRKSTIKHFLCTKLISADFKQEMSVDVQMKLGKFTMKMWHYALTGHFCCACDGRRERTLAEKQSHRAVQVPSISLFNHSNQTTQERAVLTFPALTV